MTAAVLVLLGIAALVCYALMPIPVLSLDGREAQPVSTTSSSQLCFFQ